MCYQSSGITTMKNLLVLLFWESLVCPHGEDAQRSRQQVTLTTTTTGAVVGVTADHWNMKRISIKKWDLCLPTNIVFIDGPPIKNAIMCQNWPGAHFTNDSLFKIYGILLKFMKFFMQNLYCINCITFHQIAKKFYICHSCRVIRENL